VVDGDLAPGWSGRAAAMIRLHQVTLPAGLSAFARRGEDGDVEIFVSAALPPGRQRNAVRLALRSSRRAGWRPVGMPIPLAGFAAIVAVWLRQAARILRAHTVAATAATTLAVASAAVVVATLPPRHGPPSSAPPAHSQTHSPAGHSGSRPYHGAGRTTRPAAGAPASRRPTASPSSPARGSVGPRPSPSPAPSASPSPSPAPSATQTPGPPGQTSPPPTPTPSPSPSGGCVVLLGIRICL
jgi:hypothetical protein